MTAPEMQPRTTFSGRTLEFDFPGLEIGVAEYDEGPTGCTVFRFPRGASVAADVRGGSTGTFMADLTWVHAICFAGGSLMGLEASTGVAAELFERRGHAEALWTDVPLVSRAICFDFAGRKNGIYPDRELGRAALRAAKPGVFPLGPRGAGRMATVGNGFDFDRGEASGQGAAFREVGPLKVAAFSVVNALGVIVDRAGNIVRGLVNPRTGERERYDAELERRLLATAGAAARPGNTTLTLVVTNQRLTTRDLTQVGRQVHASMARAIQPFHTGNDGDTLFALTTAEVDHEPLRSAMALGLIASDLAWDAVLSCYDPD